MASLHFVVCQLAADAQKLIDADLDRVALGQMTAKEALTIAAGKINALLKGSM